MAPEDPPEDTDANTAPSPQVRRRFVMDLQSTTPLWVIPTVAVLYVVLVLLLASGSIPAFMEVGTAVGLGVALLLGLLVVLALLGRTEDVEETHEAVVSPEDEVWTAYDEEPEGSEVGEEVGGEGEVLDPESLDAPAQPVASSTIREGVDFTWAWGEDVATVTRPPRDQAGAAAVYATTRVPLEEGLVLRLEERVARSGARA